MMGWTSPSVIHGDMLSGQVMGTVEQEGMS